MPATFELAAMLIRPGGHVANVGVHGKPATLHHEIPWTRDVTITTGLVDTYSTPRLSQLNGNPAASSTQKSTDDGGSHTARGNHENS